MSETRWNRIKLNVAMWCVPTAYLVSLLYLIAGVWQTIARDNHGNAAFYLVLAMMWDRMATGLERWVEARIVPPLGTRGASDE